MYHVGRGVKETSNEQKADGRHATEERTKQTNEERMLLRYSAGGTRQADAAKYRKSGYKCETWHTRSLRYLKRFDPLSFLILDSGFNF